MENDIYLRGRINPEDERILRILVCHILRIPDQTERLRQFRALLETFGGDDDTLRAQIVGYAASERINDII